MTYDESIVMLTVICLIDIGRLNSRRAMSLLKRMYTFSPQRFDYIGSFKALRR